MFPMDYEEFLWALGDTTTPVLLQKLFTAQKPAGESMNRKLLLGFPSIYAGWRNATGYR